MGPRGREMGPLRGLLRDSPSPLSEFIAALDSSDYCPANRRPSGPGLSIGSLCTAPLLLAWGGQAERQEAGRKDDGGETRTGSVRWARGWRGEGPHRASSNGL